MRDYALLDKVVKYKIVAIIIISWIAGSIIATVYYSSKIIKSFIQLQKTCYEGDGRAERILKEIDPNSKIRIRYTDLVLTPFMVGMFKHTIYMTEVDCDDKELKYNEKMDDIVNPGLASQKIKLEYDEYFVIGDNWNSSEDSRSNTVGNVKLSEIKGKVWLISWPFARIKLVK